MNLPPTTSNHSLALLCALEMVSDGIWFQDRKWQENYIIRGNCVFLLPGSSFFSLQTCIFNPAILCRHLGRTRLALQKRDVQSRAAVCRCGLLNCRTSCVFYLFAHSVLCLTSIAAQLQLWLYFNLYILFTLYICYLLWARHCSKGIIHMITAILLIAS